MPARCRRRRQYRAGVHLAADNFRAAAAPDGSTGKVVCGCGRRCRKPASSMRKRQDTNMAQCRAAKPAEPPAETAPGWPATSARHASARQQPATVRRLTARRIRLESWQRSGERPRPAARQAGSVKKPRIDASCAATRNQRGADAETSVGAEAFPSETRPACWRMSCSVSLLSTTMLMRRLIGL